jgi:hypothetical protein
MKLTRRDSGRKGGLTTLKRYGRDQLVEWGKLGGRPRSLGYDDIRQQQLAERGNNNNEEVNPGPPGNLSSLRRLYRLRQRSTAPEIQEAGITKATPRR